MKKFKAQHAIGFPVLHDDGGKVLDQYNVKLAFDDTAYPQDWIVGSDGTIVWFSNAFDPDQMIDVLESELAPGP